MCAYHLGKLQKKFFIVPDSKRGGSFQKNVATKLDGWSKALVAGPLKIYKELIETRTTCP